nr:MAG TPA: hypothetical protein [Caudoviricetes sp.]DAZ81128.1 MAG TPA: hypothetical protein [Caudoviricetes sp.]
MQVFLYICAVFDTFPRSGKKLGDASRFAPPFLFYI